eukprot:2422446-Prymnesium_polylepis.2
MRLAAAWRTVVAPLNGVRCLYTTLRRFRGESKKQIAVRCAPSQRSEYCARRAADPAWYLVYRGKGVRARAVAYGREGRLGAEQSADEDDVWRARERRVAFEAWSPCRTKGPHTVPAGFPGRCAAANAR